MPTAPRRQPRRYIGLVEAGVGLIPAGGGTKEMLRAQRWTRLPARADLLPAVQRVFETIGFGKVSTSAARRGAARLPARRGRHLDEPRAPARRREGAGAGSSCASGYQAPPRRTAIRVGGESCAPRSSSAFTSRGAPGASATTTPHRPEACVDPRRRLVAARDDGERGRTCSTSSAKRSSASAANVRRSSAFSTR